MPVAISLQVLGRHGDYMAKNEKTLEASFEELQGIINKLEDSSCTLEESFRLYADGMKLLKDCNDAIDKVEKQVILLEEQ